MFLDEFNLFFQENQVAYVEELCGSSRATPLLAQHGPLWFWRAGNDFQNLPATFVSSIVYSLYMSIYNEETFEKYLWIYVYVFSLLFSDCFFFKTITVFSWHVTHVYVFFVHGFCWFGCTIARMIVVDNTLWYSRVLRPTSRHDGCTSAVVDFNQHVLSSGHWHVTMLPVRDGITILQRADRKKAEGPVERMGYSWLCFFLNVYGIARPFRAFSF